ncbi:MAG TPA: hypothetical protein V6D05_02640 [Stenomitos sp.]
MKRLLIVSLLVLSAALPAFADDPKSEPKPEPYEGQKWDYRIETFVTGGVDGLPGVVANAVMSGMDGKRLQDLGKDGWELVAVVGGRAYFKRPHKEPVKAWWWPF